MHTASVIGTSTVTSSAQLQAAGISFAFTARTFCASIHSPRLVCALAREYTLKHQPDSNSPKMTRRDMLKSAGGASALLAASSSLAPFILSGCGGGGGNTIKDAILHS